MDRRLCPRCCHLSRASVAVQLVLLRTAYSQAQGCMYTALQLDGDVEQPWHMSKHNMIDRSEVHNASLRRQRRTEPRP